MKRVAVFGKPGSGKSTLSRKLAAITGLPFYALDSITYHANGQPADRVDYDSAHKQLLFQPAWIIDGLGPLGSFYHRLDEADTLVYIYLPYSVCYWLITKRLIKSLMVKPEGWPEGASVIKGTVQSYRTLKLCPSFWNAEFLQKLEQISINKTLIEICSFAELNAFLKSFKTN